MKLVSVLMCVYNTPIHYLKEAINSILEQTYTNFEFVIVNDASTENEINEYLVELDNHNDKIKVFRNEVNLGLTKSLNIGMNHCAGEYIARMDSDDISYPERLSRQVKYLDDHTDIALVGSNIDLFSDNINDARFAPHDTKYQNRELYEAMMLFEHFGPAHPTFLFRASFLRENNITYDESILKAQDYAIKIDILKAGGHIDTIYDALLAYRVHDGQITHTSSDAQNRFHEIASERYIKYMYSKLSDKDARILSTLHSSQYFFKKSEYQEAIDKLLAFDEENNTYSQEALKEVVDILMTHKKNDDSIPKKIIDQSCWYIRFFLQIIGDKLSVFLPDKLYLKIHYKRTMGKKLNLNPPVTYNEKINWLKLYDRNPMYTKLADKYAVREYVKEKIGEDYLIPLLGVWDKAEDIDFDSLPEQFVLKCTHDSGSVVICDGKNTFDRNGAVKKLANALKKNYFYRNREWVYKNIPRRIIAEQYVEDSSDKELRDYKIFCFNGIPRTMYVATSRSIGQLTFDYYDMDFNRLDIVQHYPNATKVLHKPQNFELMKQLARVLAEGIPNVRVDFFEADGKVYFGEMTFYNNGGTTAYEPEEWDYIFGDWLVLP